MRTTSALCLLIADQLHLPLDFVARTAKALRITGMTAGGRAGVNAAAATSTVAARIEPVEWR
jgi:hypothetical protein